MELISLALIKQHHLWFMREYSNRKYCNDELAGWLHSIPKLL